MTSPPNDQKEINRFAGVQRILLFALLIILIIFIAVTFLPKSNPSETNVSILDPTAAVRGEDNSLFGNIRIKTEDSLSLAYAHVLVDGADYGDLGEAELLLRVYPGDIISIDGSAYQKELQFQVTAISSNIDSEFLQTTVYSKGNIVEVGIIVFK